MRKLIALLPVLLIVVSCATFPPEPVRVPRSGPEQSSDTGPSVAQIETGPDYEKRLAIVEKARSLLGTRSLTELDRSYRRNDCTGYVVGVYRSTGYDVPLRHFAGSRRVSELLYRNLRSERLTYFNARPNIADLVFFKGTVKGRNGMISHVGIVTDILEDGTVRILHYSSVGVAAISMNLDNPHLHSLDDGRVINDYLRKRPRGLTNAPLLSGELFHAYGDLYTYSRMR